MTDSIGHDCDHLLYCSYQMMCPDFKEKMQSCNPDWWKRKRISPRQYVSVVLLCFIFVPFGDFCVVVFLVTIPTKGTLSIETTYLDGSFIAGSM